MYSLQHSGNMRLQSRQISQLILLPRHLGNAVQEYKPLQQYSIRQGEFDLYRYVAWAPVDQHHITGATKSKAAWPPSRKREVHEHSGSCCTTYCTESSKHVYIYPRVWRSASGNCTLISCGWSPNNFCLQCLMRSNRTVSRQLGLSRLWSCI